jgi:hypothetical protein
MHKSMSEGGSDGAISHYKSSMKGRQDEDAPSASSGSMQLSTSSKDIREMHGKDVKESMPKDPDGSSDSIRSGKSRGKDFFSKMALDIDACALILLGFRLHSLIILISIW